MNDTYEYKTLDNINEVWNRSDPHTSHAYDLCWWWCCWNPECETHQHELVVKNIMVWLAFLLSVWIISSAIAYIIFYFKKSEHPIKKSLLWWIACALLAIILLFSYWIFFDN